MQAVFCSNKFMFDSIENVYDIGTNYIKIVLLSTADRHRDCTIDYFSKVHTAQRRFFFFKILCSVVFEKS